MNWSLIMDFLLNTQPSAAQICLRLACAMLVGLVVGIEREYTHRPAGMRTHTLVALGACAVAITGELVFSRYAALGSATDPVRLSAQVIAGVGFLGAGTIMREGVSVKGLTTAASLWTVACLGIAAGYGYYALVIVGTVLILVTLTVFEWIQEKWFKGQEQGSFYILETSDIAQALTMITDAAARNQGRTDSYSAEATSLGHKVTFRAEFSGRHKKKHQQQFFADLAGAEHTRSFRQKDEPVPAEP